MSLDYKEPKEKCHRCNGQGTIPTPDGKHNEVCPICGGTGEKHSLKDIKWRN